MGRAVVFDGSVESAGRVAAALLSPRARDGDGSVVHLPRNQRAPDGLLRLLERRPRLARGGARRAGPSRADGVEAYMARVAERLDRDPDGVYAALADFVTCGACAECARIARVAAEYGIYDVHEHCADEPGCAQIRMLPPSR